MPRAISRDFVATLTSDEVELPVQVQIVFSSIKHAHDHDDGSAVQTDHAKLVVVVVVVVVVSTPADSEIVQLQSALDDDYNNVSGKIKHVPHFRANN